MSGINLGKMWGSNQGPTGRCFQLRDRIRVLAPHFSQSGIIRFWKSWSGIFGYFPEKVFSFDSTIALAALGCWMDPSACLIGTTNVLTLPACKCQNFADLYHCWSVINVVHMRMCSYLIFVIFFSMDTIFLHAKARKLRHNRIRDQTA